MGGQKASKQIKEGGDTHKPKSTTTIIAEYYYIFFIELECIEFDLSDDPSWRSTFMGSVYS